MKHLLSSAAQDLEHKAAHLKANLQEVTPKVSILAKELSGLGRLLKKIEVSATELLSIAERTQYETDATEKERLINLIRKPKSELTPFEKGQICFELSRRFGYSDKDVARETRYDIKQIRNFKSRLGTFTPIILEMIANGHVADHVAFEEMRAYPLIGEKYLLEAWKIAQRKSKKSLTEADLDEIGSRPQRN